VTTPADAQRPPGSQPGRVYVGWQYAAIHPDPGPPPRRPVPPEHDQLSDDWLEAQRREENLLDRPLKVAAVAAGVCLLALVVVTAAGWLAPLIAAPLFVLFVVVGGLCGYGIWQGERALSARIDAERERVERFRADQETRLFAAQAEHARQVREWQDRRFTFESQKHWYAVPLPAGIDRVDVAGGTLPGWSALLTMIGAYRLAVGGEVTVIDLSGGAVAGDLLAVARGCGIDPAVWVLPRDLPSLDLTASLDAAGLADVLALSVGASDGGSAAGGAAPGSGTARDLALDNSILERVLAVLGDDIRMIRVAAGLRVLAEVGDPRDDMASGLLSEDETSQLSTIFGRGASDRVVLERALALESQIRKLADAASSTARPPRSRLRVVAFNKRVGAASAKILGSFVVTSLTHLLSDSAPGRPWEHTLFLLGAERLRDDVLDRLADACENTRTGLVLAYRSIPPHVRQRIGRGNAVVTFMRLGNAEDAKAASEQIGTQHRFVISQLTETVGTSVTDTTGVSYTSTVGDSTSRATSASASDSVSSGSSRSRSAESSFLPFATATTSRGGESGSSTGTSESESVTTGISTSTAWGASTSTAVTGNDSMARSVQRSREFLVEASELQRLPATAMIVSYATAAGRQVFMADANPAIGSLDVSTMTPLAEAGAVRAPVAGPASVAASVAPGPAAAASGTGASAAASGTGASAADTAEPNLGPPAARLDWRRR
jgi:hypothetical protein